MKTQRDCEAFYPKDRHDPSCTQCDYRNADGGCKFFYHEICDLPEEGKQQMKTLVILSQYKAVPSTDIFCQGCAFDGTGSCPGADCKGIIWERMKTDEEVIEE